MARADYEDRQRHRRDRLQERADAARHKAEGADATLEHFRRAIPMGQPVLVGHHSERRQRRDLERMDRAMQTRHKQMEKAQQLDRRVEGVGKAGISRDDPEGIVKLKRRIAQLEAERTSMKAVNAAWRKAKKPDAGKPCGACNEDTRAECSACGGNGRDPETEAAWRPLNETFGADAVAGLRVRMMRQPFHEAPYPPYALSNLGGNLRRLKQRLEQLARAEAFRPEAVETDLFELSIDEKLDRIVLRFARRLTKEDWKSFRSLGMRWSREEEAFLAYVGESEWERALARAREIEAAG